MRTISPQHQCQHILDSGLRCGSPRMKRKEFCYYHLRLHDSFLLPGQPQYEAPALDNLHSVSLALTHVLRAQAKRLITPAEAKAMLYNLQLAQHNLRLIQKTTPIAPDPNSLETSYTPAMRRILYLDDEPAEANSSECRDICSQHEPSECRDGRPRPSDPSATTSDNAHVTTSPSHAVIPSASEEPMHFADTDDTADPLPTRRPPHPLRDAHGLRPWDTPAPASPVWTPITSDELELIEAAGLPRYGEPKTHEQAWNKLRLRISQSLPNRLHATTQELIAAVAHATHAEAELERLAEEEKRQAEVRRQAWLRDQQMVNPL